MKRFSPTPRAEWVKAGDRCQAVPDGPIGEVQRIVDLRSIPVAVVKWPTKVFTSGFSIGRHSITTIRKVK